MKFIDLFAGIGGFRYGFEKTENFKCVWSNEWDKYATSIYKKHFGDCDTRDITTVPSSEIPDHDLLVGGFPCQSFSVAGKRQGFNDTTRGTLFFEIARILRDKRPRYLLLENVKGLLSHDEGKTFQTILGLLSDLGYDCQWQVLNSKNFGVPQNRERVFIIGHLREKPQPKVFPLTKDGEFSYQEQQQPIRGSLQTSQQENSSNSNESVLEDGKDGQLHYIGGIEGQRERWLRDGKNKSRNFSQGQRVYGADGISSTLAGNAGGLGGKTGLYAIPVLTPNRINKRQNGRRFKENGEPSFTLTGQDIHGVMTEGMKIRRLTPMECERLQGFEDGWTEGISDTQRYKCLGNAVTTNVITEIGKRLLKNE